MLPISLIQREQPVRLIHHAANCDPCLPAGSPTALEACLSAGSALVEIDVVPLADGSFALMHDRFLEVETSGKGDAIQSSRSKIEKLTYKVNGEVTSHKVGFLEEAIDIFAAHPEALRLQLDLKPYTPLTQAVLREFVRILAPVLDRIQVTSVSDWAVRSLRRFSPELALGFDPLLYLDLVDDDPRPEGIPPFRVGAYGLRDDHPLSSYQWGPLGEYFAARAAALLVQAPEGCEWYIRAELLEKARKAGFDWVQFLHQQGSRVDGWTINAADPKQVRLAETLVDLGIDELTTDTPALLAKKLGVEAIY
jgi:glycerophosphoryl diester phosphodiesterase